MISSEGGSQPPLDEAQSSPHIVDTSPSGTQTDTRRRSSALACRPDNIIGAEDPTRILECMRLERQRQFQYLVRRYLSQILYGCKSVYCDTPTCLSRNKRGAVKPYRAPTQLTARALAHYLASQSEPHRGLCPHELKVAPRSLQIEVAVGSSISSGLGVAGDQAQRVERLRVQALASIIDSRHQSKKDTKSIGQNLYDSVSLIYSYSKSIPSSSLTIDTLRASANGAQADAFLDSANGAAVTAHANETICVSRQQSRQNSHAQYPAHASQKHSYVLSNGQRVHKVPYFRPTVLDERGSLTNQDNPPTEDMVEASRMSISKSGRKSFTLGGSIVPPVPKSKAASLQKTQHKTRLANDNPRRFIPTASTLNCDTLEQLKDDINERLDPRSATSTVGDDCTPHQSRVTNSFVDRSLFYILGDAEALLRSFQDSTDAFQRSPLPHLDSAQLVHSFRDWSQLNGSLIFDSLHVALHALFARPPELEPQVAEGVKATSDHRTSSNNEDSTTRPRYLNNYEAAHIVMICIHALTSSVPVAWPRTWVQLRSLRSWGVIVPSVTADADNFADPYANIIDSFEYEPAARLADRLLRAIGVRNCFDHILRSKPEKSARAEAGFDESEESLLSILTRHLEVTESVALASKRKLQTTNLTNKEPGWTVTATLTEWLKTIIIKNWDGNVEINKWSSIGSAVMLLHKLYDHQRPLNIWSRMIRLPYLHEHMNAVTDPIKYLSWRPQLNTLHVLQYPELHPTDYVVKFFRVVNLTSMMAQYNHTQHTQQMLRQLDCFLREPYLYMIKHRLKVTLNDYLVLDVSREQPLKDTLDQLWRQERRMLLKPLKVKLGQHEGEVGLDHGGVTYEFFRIVLGDAFAPDYGMFTVDSRTRMTWFQPGSLEPLWKFKMLGVLFSLAIYNGITLPVTFPLAFYNLMLNSRFKFLDDHTSIDYIRDGWPDLAKSFETMLNWQDGDVADVFMREYAFSYSAFNHTVDIDMTKHDDDSPTSEETPLVTNETRGMFVRDYVTYLILRTIRPQLKAFKQGFHTCLEPRSLDLFTPKTLKQLVEGTQTISMPDLRACATYEDYDATHPTIRMFWDIVEDYSQEDATRLLEFVTASDRVPVTGYKSLTFNIVRMGRDSEQLPTSSTCFGKLYLPEYRDKEKMTRKLQLAIQNAKGFGVV